MAVEWTDPSTIQATPSTEGRSADFNTALDDLLYLYDPPRCAVRLTAGQTVADSSDHTISWDEAVWDSHGDMTDISGAPSKITMTREGVYGFQFTELWGETQDGGKRAAFLHVNGTRRRDFHQSSADGVSPFALSSYIETNVAANDEIDVRVRQTSGSDLDLSQTRTVLVVRWVAAAPASGE